MGTPKAKISPANLSKFRFNGGSGSSKMAPNRRADVEDVMEDDEISLPASDDSSRGNMPSDRPLTYAMMTDIAADIKSSFTEAITDIKTELMRLSEQMAVTERAGKRRDRALIRLDDIVIDHSNHLIDMNRHLEDLDNRGRRHNIRVRGVPESVPPDQIRPTLTSIFNSLMDRPEASPIEFDRAHRALRPKAPDNTPPRDIICCLPNYTLKEEILHKARLEEHITFNEAEIQLYQDLSPITLKNRRALRPLLEVLKTKDITYRWKFPFALQATYNGRQFTLRIPEELQKFCECLQIIPMDLPEWYAEFRLPPEINNMPPKQGPSPAKSPFQQNRSRGSNNRSSYNSPAAKNPRLGDSK